jgi:hypothetical protein
LTIPTSKYAHYGVRTNKFWTPPCVSYGEE